MMTMTNCESPVVPSADGTAARRYFGKYAGIVLDNAPPAPAPPADPLPPGSIQVQVPGILEEAPPSGPPAPTAPGAPPPPITNQPLTVLAMPAFLPGFYFIPQKQAPVWVEFVGGDINFPIWTGVWYPTNGAPQDSDDTTPDQDQKVIRTASNQVIHLSDKSGSEKTVIKDETNGNTVTLDKNGVLVECLIGQNGATNTVTMDSSGVTIESLQTQSNNTATITMDSSGVTVTFGSSTVSIQNGTIQVTAGQGPTAPQVTVDQSNGVTLSAGPTTQVALSSSQGVKMTSALGALSPVMVAPSTLLNWLLGHQHVGNMGAPTPLFPADIVSLTAITQGNLVASSTG